MPKKSLKIALFKFSIEGANMALTTTQVNTAFLAALARPAEGSAATWGAGSLNLDSLLNNIFIAENTEDFVESLYTEFLGRASDAEGKAFWNSLLATTSKEAVLAQFKAAILAAGQADPSNADYQGLIATNKAFVQTLYTNLLGREADAEGLDFWANALTSGTSRGDLLAQFTAAAMASGADNDDYQAITAKLAVADAFSAKFSAFNADVTADEKKAALDALKAMMEGVVAGSTVEDVQEEINQIAGNYQNRTSQVFTKANDDDLDASEATAATTFRGTVNLIDPAKGTIQDTDKVTGNTDFDDTLVVNVTSDSTHKLLDLNGDLPTVSDIEKLIVNNGSANVEGDLNDANFGKSVSITGTGDVNLKVNSSLENLSVSSATKGDVAIAVNNKLGNYTGGNAGESVTVASTGSIKKASLGAGDDTLVINGVNAVLAGGAIDLGAGNDELEINSNITVAANEEKITLDGGAGSKDILTLNGAFDLSGVKSIKGFETINAQSNATISSEAANGLKAKLIDGSALTVNASTGTTAINLSGLSVDKNESATVSLQGLTQETITLSKTVTENIDISNAAAKNITIKGFVNGSDKLSIEQGATKSVITDATATKGLDLSKAGQVLDLLNKAGLSAGTSYVAINTSNGKASYIWKVEGTTATRDNITLVANVDKALTEADLTGEDGPVVVPGKAVDFVTPSAPSTLNLAADSYNNFTIADQKNIFVNGIDNALTISGAKTAELVEAFITNSGGTVDAETAGNVKAQVNVYLGGSKDDAGTLTAGTRALDFATATKENDAIAKGAKALYANVSGAAITLKDAKTFGTVGSELKLDLSLVNADIKFGATANDQAAIDLTTLVTGEDASDKVAVSGGATTTKIVGTKAADTITLGTNITATEISVDFGAGGNDTLVATAQKISGSTQKGYILTSNAGSGDKVVLGTTSSLSGDLQKVDAAQTWTTDLKTTLELILAGVSGGSGVAKSVVVGKIEGATGVDAKYNGTYVIYNESADVTLTDNNDIVVFLGNVDLAKVSLDAAAASATGIVIA